MAKVQRESSKSLKESLIRVYEQLLDAYGYQGWWPIDREYHLKRGTNPEEEIIIGAVLTQNTSWKNVERALENLKVHGEISLEYIRREKDERLKELIKPSGFYNQKAKRLKLVAQFFNPIEVLKTVKRDELLNLKGIGGETADVILLYAGDRLTFVIDRYTQRFFERFYNLKRSYEALKAFFEENLPKDLKVYKEFHALMDQHAKVFCRNTPLCGGCPIRNQCISASPSS
ncbi:MAG: endonuclease III domain-containing protein [Aquificaceae bacterium]